MFSADGRRCFVTGGVKDVQVIVGGEGEGAFVLMVLWREEEAGRKEEWNSEPEAICQRERDERWGLDSVKTVTLPYLNRTE